MLDRDPIPPRPPDPRPRPRPHKPKNVPKKQPQRGLGVAQLEKLRLEEQSKQEAACLASLHHHHHNLPQQQLQLQLHQLQRLQLSPPVPLGCFLPRQIKLPDDKSPLPLLSDLVCSSSSSSSPREQPRSFLPCSKLNCGNAHNSFVPLAGMAAHSLGARRQGLLQQQCAEESEPCLSQVHDLCSPGSAISGTIPTNERANGGQQQRLASDASFPSKSNLSSYLPSLFQSGALRHNQDESDDLYAKTKDSTASLFPSVCLNTEKEMQNVAGGNKTQNEGAVIPFTDLCLLQPSARPFDAHLPYRLESPMVSIASTGVQARELSSFQTFSISPAWSSRDQVFNRKRPWQLTQEPAKAPDQSLKGVDLNASADEVESESTERDSPPANLPAPSGVSCPASSLRDAWVYSASPLLSSTSTEENVRLWTLNRPCTECGSVPESLSAKMYMVSSAFKADHLHASSNGVHDPGAPFFSIRKGGLGYDGSHIHEAETCGDFLTLGPSSSLIRKHGNTNIGAGNRTCGHFGSDTGKVRNSNETAALWQSWPSLPDQAKGVGKFLPMVSRVANGDVLMRTAEHAQTEHYGSPLQINVELSTCLAWTKVEDHPGHRHPSAADEGSLDLELRLSL